MADLTYEASLLDGLASLLDANGIGTYLPDGYPPDSTGTAIVFAVTPAQPANVITLTKYLDLPGPLGSATTMVQIRTRTAGSPFAAADVTDRLRDLLHRRAHFTLGNARIDLCQMESFATLGVDENGRHLRSMNFAFRGLRGTRI